MPKTLWLERPVDGRRWLRIEKGDASATTRTPTWASASSMGPSEIEHRTIDASNTVKVLQGVSRLGVVGCPDSVQIDFYP